MMLALVLTEKSSGIKNAQGGGFFSGWVEQLNL